MKNERPTTASTMSRIDLFLDSSALFAGIASPRGAARALLLLAEADQITITVSEQVVAETERALARKLPQALRYYREAIRSAGVRIVRDPSREEIEAHQDIITHRADVPIVVAAMTADVDYLVTLNRRHFIEDPKVADQARIRIGTPGDALAWLRGRLAQAGQ
jgi:predicted nucleic acid-binding protein